MTSTAPRNLHVAGVRCAATLTAVSSSRAFVRQTLGRWQLADQVADAEVIVSELVTNAVKVTGVSTHRTPAPRPERTDIRACHVIEVQLRQVDRSLYVEVWDAAEGSPKVPEQDLDAEGGRGLFLVGALATRWDVHHPQRGGKVVWAELALPPASSAR